MGGEGSGGSTKSLEKTHTFIYSLMKTSLEAYLGIRITYLNQ